MKTIMLAFREGSENGGPFNSHLRIMESSLKDKYNFVQLIVPKGRMGLFNISLLKSLIKQIHEVSPDAVQIVGLEMIGFYLALACRIARVKKIIVAIHGSTTEAIEFNKNPLKKFISELLEIYTLKSATITYGVSKYVETIKNVRRYSKNYYGEIYNMLISSTNSYQREKTLEEFGISKEKIVVISTGRLIREKGYEILTKVMKHYADNDKIAFVIAGDGNYLSEMKKELIKQIEAGQVNLLGYRKDISHILSGGDIFIMPSYHETLCMSLMEAGQSGLAMIASNVGGMKEIVENDNNGFLVEAGNANVIIEKIDFLMQNKETLNKMKMNARWSIEKKFSNVDIIKKLDELYSIVVGE